MADRVLQQGLGFAAEEWERHMSYEHASASSQGGECRCGRAMPWADHALHVKQEMAMAVAAWARLAPMGTDDAVRHALQAARDRLAAGEEV